MKADPRMKTRALTRSRFSRRGAVLVLAAFSMIVIMAFVALALDLGYIALAKTQMQGAADAAALAAGIELPQALGLGPTKTSTQVVTLSQGAASTVAGAHRIGEQTSAYLSTARDVRFGKREWNPLTGAYVETWGTGPYTMVEVTLHRDQASANGDKKLPLFFAPVIGTDTANLDVTATAYLQSGSGFRLAPNSPEKIHLLPFTLDLPTWTNLVAGIGDDSYTYHTANRNVSGGSDGIKEVNLYPVGSVDLPPGNRGTLDLGLANNATDTIARQILEGLNATDLSVFPNNTITTANGPIVISGDTGISAGFKEELEAIKGKPRAIPIFSSVAGNGDNAQYTIVKFVGIRIMDVKLSGVNKHVIIQPCPFTQSTVVPGSGPLSNGFFSPIRLLH